MLVQLGALTVITVLNLDHDPPFDLIRCASSNTQSRAEAALNKLPQRLEQRLMLLQLLPCHPEPPLTLVWLHQARSSTLYAHP
jgi:hypothetical protein